MCKVAMNCAHALLCLHRKWEVAGIMGKEVDVPRKVVPDGELNADAPALLRCGLRGGSKGRGLYLLLTQIFRFSHPYIQSVRTTPASLPYLHASPAGRKSWARTSPTPMLWW